jgi:DNA-binding helix-hairpin-helix protein with protein kinase domain
MATFYDSEGKPHKLSREIGRGGEGAVYECSVSNGLVAKIYHEQIDDEKAGKLLWMAQNSDENLLKIAAWVVDTLHAEPGGRVAGFLMPHVNAKEIHELYSTKSRRIYFPDATWHFLVHSAANVARAFYSLHSKSHFMGDVNHGNCVVLADGTVKLIDCDSFGIKAGDKRYVCEVGVNTHLAPELQGKTLRDIERTESHDNFGLAVIVFQLLFLGRHPFAGNFRAMEDLSLEEAIEKYLFAYSATASERGVVQPPGTLTLQDIPDSLSSLFERAFSPDHDRPKPTEWIEHLADLNNNLEQCSIHPGHHYSSGLTHCPWCRIESHTGITFFPYVSTDLAETGGWSLDVSTIEQLLADLEKPHKLKKRGGRLPNPSPEVAEAATTQNQQHMVVVTGYFCVLALTGFIGGIGAAGLLGFVLLIPLILFVTGINKSVRESLTSVLYDKEADLDSIESKIKTISGNESLKQDIALMRSRLSAYDDFIADTKLLKSAENGDGDGLLNSHLRTHAISDALELPITTQQVHRLKASGIATAADISRDAVDKVEWLEGKTRTDLAKWRGDVEKAFDDTSFPRSNGLVKTEDVRFRRQKTLELEMNALLNKINAANQYFRQNEKGLIDQTYDLRREVRQLRSDVRTLGNGGTVVIILFLIAVFLPIIGAIMGEVFGTKANVLSSAPQTVSRGIEEAYSGKSIESILKEFGIPNESILDEEIKELPLSTRKLYAANLNSEARKIGTSPKEFELVIRLLNFSLRFDQSQETVEALGNARKTGLAEDFLDLGMAYTRLESYSYAEEAFRISIAKDPTNDAHLMLGIVLKKQGKIREAEKQLETLTKLSKLHADTLRDEIEQP